MPYVDRNQAGHVIGIYSCAQYEGQEFVESAEIWVDPDVVKKRLLKEAMSLRDTLLWHLERERRKAVGAGATAPVLLAIDNAISSLEGFFNDQRIVTAVDGAVKQWATIVYLEITNTLKVAHRPTFDAIKALDPI